MKAVNPGRSLASCIRDRVKFYAAAGIEIKESTAKKKYQRAARKKMGANVPTPTTPQEDSESGEKPQPS